MKIVRDRGRWGVRAPHSRLAALLPETRAVQPV